MADFNLITLLPAQQIAGIQNPALPTGVTTQGGSSATLLPSLPVGSVISGFIINRDANGNPVLRTDKGDIAFSTQFFLKIGSEVVIRIANTGGNTQAHIVTVDGQSPEVAQTLSSFAHDPNVIVSPRLSQFQSASQPTAPVANAAPAGVSPRTALFTGTLITAPHTRPDALDQNGSELTLRLVRIELPAAAASPAKTPSLIPQGQQSPVANNASYATYARAAATPVIPTPSAPQAAAAEAPAPAVTAAPAVTTSAPKEAAVLEPSSGGPAAASLPSVTPAAAKSDAATPVAASPAAASPAAASPPAAPASAPSPNLPAATKQYVSFTNAIAASSTSLLESKVLPSGLPQSPIFARVPQAVQSLLPDLPAPVQNIAVPPQALPQIQPLPAPLRPGDVITAQVIGQEPTGETLVQTQAGIIRLGAGASAPPGSTITLEVSHVRIPLPAEPNAALPATVKPAPMTELAQQWTSLQQVFSLLQGRTTPTGLEAFLLPPAAAGQPANAAPGEITGKTISNALLLFISALRGGALRDWLGSDNVDYMEDRGNSGLVKKIGAEFVQMARQFNEAQPNQWQPLFFPLAVDGMLQQVRLYVKRDRQKESQGRQRRQEDDTRFVIEVDLTQLGELQMDGFVRKAGKETQFDMIIRSLIPLSKEIQEDILKIYTSTGEMTGYKGSLFFQAVRAFPVNPMEDIAKAANPVVA